MTCVARAARFASAVLLLVVMAGSALAYNYPLQYTPVGNYTNLVLAGYQFSGKNVIGNCSYVQVATGAGGAPTYTPVKQTCTWDPFGMLISVAAGAPAVPAPVGIIGSQTIYARWSGAPKSLYAGFDSASYYGGFIWHWSPHFSWIAPGGSSTLNSATPYTFYTYFRSDGDKPLTIINIHLKTLLGRATVNNTACLGPKDPGAFCAVNVTYDPSGLTSPTGVIQDTLTMSIASDATDEPSYLQSFTVNVPVSH